MINRLKHLNYLGHSIRLLLWLLILIPALGLFFTKLYSNELTLIPKLMTLFGLLLILSGIGIESISSSNARLKYKIDKLDTIDNFDI